MIFVNTQDLEVTSLLWIIGPSYKLFLHTNFTIDIVMQNFSQDRVKKVLKKQAQPITHPLLSLLACG
jgi:hypothetical protein